MIVTAQSVPPSGVAQSAAEKDLIAARRWHPPANRDFWVFGYGSLMWRPDFPYAETQGALLQGYHRAFCVRSTHYRGSPDRPGLVLGLDRGGICHGRAFRVTREDGPGVAQYLHDRELITAIYEPHEVPVVLNDGRDVTALAYVVDRHHPEYEGVLSAETIATRIAAAAGVSGSNLDYLRNTLSHLDEFGIEEAGLRQILERIDS